VEKEVRAIQKLCGLRTHPNIVQVENHGLLWHHPYYSIDMELCDMNLNDFIHPKTAPDPSKTHLPCFVKGGGTDSLLQIWTVMNQIASGVEYIHRQSQIHRDIKPGNGDTQLGVTD
jgi:serine/threonine protein kinase